MMASLRVGQIGGIDDPEPQRSRGLEPPESGRLTQDGPSVTIGRPVAHHTRDHHRSLLVGHGRIVCLQFRPWGSETRIRDWAAP